MRAPEFWSHGGALPAVLSPLAALYDLGSRTQRALARPWRASVPVICAGNIVAGGAGKTPVAIALARRLIELGKHPHFLSRGYGGTEAGPLRVDRARHDAGQVGDEPLLLAGVAPAWIARDRPAGARAAITAGADMIVMDDGLQNPTIEKDLSLMVVDGGYGFGNRHVMPAGPLRETIDDGLSRVDAVVLVGDDEAGCARLLDGRKPVLRARLMPELGAEDIANRDVVAFAGIGRPEKFFATLRELGCRIVAARSFADHHRYTAEDVMHLVEVAAAREAIAVTTEKDAVRLPPEARGMVRVLKVALQWESPAALDTILKNVL